MSPAWSIGSGDRSLGSQWEIATNFGGAAGGAGLLMELWVQDFADPQLLWQNILKSLLPSTGWPVLSVTPGTA